MFNYVEDFFEAAHKITGFILGEGRFEIKKIFDEFKSKGDIAMKYNGIRGV